MIGLRVDTRARNGAGDFIKSLSSLMNCPCESHDYDGDRLSRHHGAKESVIPVSVRCMSQQTARRMPEPSGTTGAAPTAP